MYLTVEGLFDLVHSGPTGTSEEQHNVIRPILGVMIWEMMSGVQPWAHWRLTGGGLALPVSRTLKSRAHVDFLLLILIASMGKENDVFYLGCFLTHPS